MAKQKYLTKALRCPDGSRKYIRGKTQAELDRKVMQAQVELGLGININDDTRVVELAQMWVDVYKQPQLKPQSAAKLKTVLNTHIIPVIGQKTVREILPADCARVMSRASGKAHATQATIRTTMRALFECAVDNNLIARNPVTKQVVATGAPTKERVPLTPEQLGQLCQALRGKDQSLYTFVLLCGYAGLRAGEALGLHLDSVDLGAGTLTVREQYITLPDGRAVVSSTLKTPTSHRTLHMPPALYAHMAQLKRERGTGYVFDVTQPGLFGSMSSRLALRCQVDASGNPRSYRRSHALVPFYVHPHLLRHTYATMCFVAGMDVKEVQHLLGHSTPDITMSIYLHYHEEQRRDETAQKLDAAFPHPDLTALSG